MKAASSDNPEVSSAYRRLLLVAAGMTYLLIFMGGIVCITGAARACPDWPGCYGRVVPPLRIDSIIEYTHRLLALCTGLLIIASAAVGWTRYRSLRWLSVPPLIAIVLVFMVATFGAMAVLYGLSPALAAVDLGMALMVLALLVTAAVVAQVRGTALRISGFFSNAIATWASCGAIAVFAVLASGPLGGDNGPMRKCLAWPLYLERAAAVSSLDIARYLVADLAALCVVMLVILGWRARHRAPRLLQTTYVVGALFLVLLVLGTLIGPSTLPWMAFLYIATTVGFWAALTVLVVLAGLASRSDEAGTGIARTAMHLK